MGNKNSNDGHGNKNNRMNILLNEYLMDCKRKSGDGSDREDFNKNIRNDSNLKLIVNESGYRSKNIINTALNLSNEVIAKSIMKDKKINSNLYSTLFYINTERMFREPDMNFLQDYNQLEQVEILFDMGRELVEVTKDSDDDTNSDLVKIMKNIKHAVNFTDKNYNLAKNKITYNQSKKLDEDCEKANSIQIPQYSPLKEETTSLKIVETEIEKKTEGNNSLGSFVIPTEIFNKSFDEMSLQEYLNMETQRLKLNRDLKYNDIHKNSTGTDDEINSTKKSSENFHKLNGNRLLTEPDPDLNLIRNKNSEKLNTKSKFINKNSQRNSHLINSDFITHNEKENKLLRTTSNFNNKRNNHPQKQKINYHTHSENTFNKYPEKLMRGGTMKTQTKNIAGNLLLRSNTTRSGFNNNLKNKVSNSNKYKGFDLKFTQNYNSTNNISKMKKNPIACIKIDIRDLLKEEFNNKVLGVTKTLNNNETYDEEIDSEKERLNNNLDEVIESYKRDRDRLKEKE